MSEDPKRRALALIQILALARDGKLPHPVTPQEVEEFLLNIVDKPMGGKVLRAKRDPETNKWLFKIEQVH